MHTSIVTSILMHSQYIIFPRRSSNPKSNIDHEVSIENVSFAVRMATLFSDIW